jgi:hypothetical protein
LLKYVVEARADVNAPSSGARCDAGLSGAQRPLAVALDGPRAAEVVALLLQLKADPEGGEKVANFSQWGLRSLAQHKGAAEAAAKLRAKPPRRVLSPVVEKPQAKPTLRP